MLMVLIKFRANAFKNIFILSPLLLEPLLNFGARLLRQAVQQVQDFLITGESPGNRGTRFVVRNGALRCSIGLVERVGQIGQLRQRVQSQGLVATLRLHARRDTELGFVQGLIDQVELPLCQNELRIRPPERG